jgi:hypothetical protein
MTKGKQIIAIYLYSWFRFEVKKVISINPK